MARLAGSAGFSMCSRRQALAFAGAAVVLLSACSRELPPPPIRIGMNTWLGYDPLVLARDRQLLDVNQIRVIELGSTSETMRHFRNGLLDVAALTLDEALRLSSDGVDLRVVAVIDESLGGDVVLVAPGITSLAQLKGARIAVETRTTGALVLHQLLKAAGLQPHEVQVLNIEAMEQLVALKSQKVSVAISYEPVAQHLRDAGFKPLFDSAQLPGQVIDVYAVRTDFLQAFPGQVDAFLAAWQRGVQEFQQHPDRSVNLLAPGVDVTPEHYLEAMGQIRLFDAAASLAWMEGETSPLAQQAGDLVKMLQDMRVIEEASDWKRLIDPAPLRRVLSNQVTP